MLRATIIVNYLSYRRQFPALTLRLMHACRIPRMTSGKTQSSIAGSRIFRISALAGWRLGLAQVSAMSQGHHLARQTMLAFINDREEATLGNFIGGGQCMLRVRKLSVVMGQEDMDSAATMIDLGAQHYWICSMQPSARPWASRDGRGLLRGYIKFLIVPQPASTWNWYPSRSLSSWSV